jgi:hypothetical protein
MLWKGNKMFTSIPFPIVEDRPLIAYHPGPHWNYLASWNVMVDNGQPFVLICDDFGPDYPDGGWGQHSKDGMEYFARVDNPIGIGQAYRNPDLPFQNLLVHRQIDAKVGMEELPFIDILYIDFPELFTGYNEQSKHPLLRAASSLSSKVRDGGLIISDRKNFDDRWPLPVEKFQVDDNVMWEPLGKAEWFIIPQGVELHCSGNQDIVADLFRVYQKKEFPNCFDFLASLMKHRRMSVEELQGVIEKAPKRWPFHMSVNQYYALWNRHQEFGSGRFEHPVPQGTPWKDEMFAQWIEWLIAHPDQLRPRKRKERHLKIGEVDVTLVHGDITEHLDWLESKNASLVLRRKLLTRCLEINPFLWKNSVNLQPKWENPPIPKLRWSGEDATTSLTSKLMKLSKTSVLATIGHGLANLDEMKTEFTSSQPIEKVLIFYSDKCDYL